MPEILSDIPTFLVAFVVGTLLEAVVIWVGLVTTGLATTLPGLLIMAAMLSAVWLLLPTYLAVLIGTILFYFLALKLTDAEGFVDVQLLIIVMNLVSFLLQLYIFTKAMDYLPENVLHGDSADIEMEVIEMEVPGGFIGDTPSVNYPAKEEPVPAERAPEINTSGSDNAYDAYKGRIGQDELDRINKLTSFSDELAEEIQQHK